MQSQEQNFSQKYKTPCNNQHTEKACFAWECRKRIFQHSIATRRARICHHKNEIFRKSTKRPAIINITARDYFIWECSRPSFGILLLSEEHELALMASCGETGNDLARNICKPYAYTHQRVCNHKSRIFRRNIKRPAINQHGRESLFHMGMQQTDFPAFYCYQKCPHGELWRNWE